MTRTNAPVTASSSSSLSSGWVRRLAIVAAGCFAVSACGAGSPETVAVEPIPRVVPPEDGGPQYGDSLEDWNDAVTGSESAVESQSADPAPPGFTELTWEDLVPPGASGDEIFARYEDRLAAVEDGSPEADEIYAEMQAEYDANAEVNEELDGTKVYLAGFVAPLTFDDDIITEFLLVPYFGACIHVPPPPPNQTVLVTLDKSDGLSLDESWGAIWVAGTVTLDTATTDLANASYTMTDATSGVYDEFG